MYSLMKWSRGLCLPPSSSDEEWATEVCKHCLKSAPWDSVFMFKFVVFSYNWCWCSSSGLAQLPLEPQRNTAKDLEIDLIRKDLLVLVGNVFLPESAEVREAPPIQKVMCNSLSQMQYRKAQVVKWQQVKLFFQQVQIKQALSLQSKTYWRKIKTKFIACLQLNACYKKCTDHYPIKLSI